MARTAISLALSVCEALNAARTARVCRKHADYFWTSSSDARKSQEAPMRARIAADTMFLEFPRIEKHNSHGSGMP